MNPGGAPKTPPPPSQPPSPTRWDSLGRHLRELPFSKHFHLLRIRGGPFPSVSAPTTPTLAPKYWDSRRRRLEELPSPFTSTLLGIRGPSPLGPFLPRDAKIPAPQTREAALTHVAHPQAGRHARGPAGTLWGPRAGADAGAAGPGPPRSMRLLFILHFQFMF